MNRLHYLEEVAEYTGSAYKSLLKKEAGYWIDQILLELTLSVGEQQCYFYANFDKRRITYCQYTVKHCHVYFNSALPTEYNTLNILKNIFHLAEGDIHTMLRPRFKKYLKDKGVPIEKKIKFFFRSSFF